MTKLRNVIVVLLGIAAAVTVYFTPQTPDEPHRVAVFGRTLCPWCPPHAWDGHVVVKHRSADAVLE